MIQLGLLFNNFPSQQLYNKIIMQLFIQTKLTPNPNFLKFIPTGKTVMNEGTMDFVAPRYAHPSPLAKKLFAIDGVNRVFYGQDHLSISKQQESDWNEIKPQIYSLLMEHFSSDQKLFTDEPEREDTKINENDSEIVQMIQEIIDTRVRPTVQQDGGDIEYRSFDDKTGLVKILMKGSCSGCPSSSVTLKQGIQKMLMHYVPEVTQVVAEDLQKQ